MSRYVFQTLLLIFLCCTPVLQGFSQQNEPVVVLFGDSISAGIIPGVFEDGIGAGQENYGLPSIELDSLLEGSRRPTTVLNWGYGGTPSGPSLTDGLSASGNDGVSRISAVIDATRSAHTADQYYVLVLYGTNDFGWGIMPSDTNFYLRTIIARAQAKGSDIIPIVGNNVTCSGCGSLLPSYNQAIQLAAQSRSVPFVNHASNFAPQLISNDGLHPNQAGYAKLAQNWFDFQLEALIEQRPPAIAPVINLLLFDDD